MSLITPVLPVSPKTLTPGNKLTGWTHPGYLAMRQATFDPQNADGFTTRRAEVINALNMAASYDEVKDWVPAAREDAAELWLKSLTAIANLRIQYLIRALAPVYVAASGSDVGTIWSDDGWNTIMQEWERSWTPIPAGIMQIVHLLTPVMASQNEYPRQMVPPSYTVYYKPAFTVAQMRTLRAEILALSIGLTHFRKIRINWGQFTRNLIEGPLRYVGLYPQSSESLFWHNNIDLTYKTTGTSTVTRINVPGVFEANGEADRRYFWLDHLWQLHAMLPWLAEYHANNLSGCVTLANPANDDDLNVELLGFTNTAMTQLAFDLTRGGENVEINSWMAEFGALSQVLKHTLTATGRNLGTLDDPYNSIVNVRSQVTSVGAWANAFQDWLARLMRNEAIYASKAVKMPGGVDKITGAKPMQSTKSKKKYKKPRGKKSYKSAQKRTSKRPPKRKGRDQ
jgi:hypothetical protein